MFGFGKNQCLTPATVMDQAREHCGLLLFVHRVNRLRNRRRSSVARCDRNFNRVAYQPFGQLANIIREGRREHQILTALGQQTNNAFNIMNKAHIQHAVGLIEHQHLQIGELHCVLAVEVHQTAGRRNEDIDTATQLDHLRIDFYTTKNHSRGQRQVLAVSRDALPHLSS